MSNFWGAFIWVLERGFIWVLERGFIWVLERRSRRAFLGRAVGRFAAAPSNARPRKARLERLAQECGIDGTT